MPSAINHRVLLKSRPDGIPGPGIFQPDEKPVKTPGPGQLLVRNKYLSIDPAMKGWIGTAPNYSQPVGSGQAMRSGAVGEVVASHHEDSPRPGRRWRRFTRARTPVR